jgi:hypothetical protein
LDERNLTRNQDDLRPPKSRRRVWARAVQGISIPMPENIPPNPQVEKLAEALAQAKVKGECVACGHNEWVPFHGLVRIPTAVEGTRGMPALAIACQHCGNVRFHVSDVLEQYAAPNLPS